MTDHEAALRQEVGLLRARESRRIFDATVGVGRLGGDVGDREDRQGFVVRAQDLPAIDGSLRTDVMSALLEQTEAWPAAAWVARAGCPTPHDVDLQWLAATMAAFGAHGRALEGFYAITRAGWLDVRTGESRTWKRLRL
jgi:hypothetical protein